MTSLPEIEPALNRMTEALRTWMRDKPNPYMVGIRTGGVWVAQHLHSALGLESSPGILDIGFHRDDFSRAGMKPNVGPSALSEPVDGRDIILVDDVLHTGRTIRAALNELFDYGRPARVCLAVLVDRAGHELPIRADVAGMTLSLPSLERIKLSGPAPLRLLTGEAS